MENSNHNPALRQKLEQHDLGYTPGAWENFEQLLNANPVAAPKKSFWNVKKWLGLGAAAVILAGGAFALYPSESAVPVATPTTNVNITNTEKSTENTTNTISNTTAEKSKKTATEVMPMSVAAPNTTTTTKNAAALSQNDDNSHPQEVDLKIRPVQPHQRASKSASDESGVFSVSNHKKETENTSKKNHDAGFHKAPDAHELDAHEAPAPKKGKQ